MNIVPQNYNNLLKNIILNTFSSNLESILYNSINDSNSVFNYVNLLSNLDNYLCNIALM